MKTEGVERTQSYKKELINDLLVDETYPASSTLKVRLRKFNKKDL